MSKKLQVKTKQNLALTQVTSIDLLSIKGILPPYTAGGDGLALFNSIYAGSSKCTISHQGMGSQCLSNITSNASLSMMNVINCIGVN